MIVVFLGGDYNESEWCGLEWRAIRDIIKTWEHERVMLIRFDDEPIDGLFGIDGYIDARKYEATSMAELVLDRASDLGRPAASDAGNAEIELVKKIAPPIGISRHTKKNSAGRQTAPAGLIDKGIGEELDLLVESRFFEDYNRQKSSLNLGRRLYEGDLSYGSDAARSEALAWCARLLSRTESTVEAERFLECAEELGGGPECEIAHCFLASHRGDKAGALSKLAQINSPASRSASLMVVLHHDGKNEAVGWLGKSGLGVSDLDADGKFILLSLQLELGDWDELKATIPAVLSEDLNCTPALWGTVAFSHLVEVVPEELRDVVLRDVPFESAAFPLESSKEALESRSRALEHFKGAATAAHQLNCTKTAIALEDYALWLMLRDHDHAEKGKLELSAKLRIPSSALRLVPLAVHFGVKLDLPAVEEEIDRQIALHGKVTDGAAKARFAIAFTQVNPGETAKYIERHLAELCDFIDRKALLFLQVEVYSKAGLVDRATEILETALREGLSDGEERRLRRIMAEAQGTSPIEARIEQYEASGSLQDLAILVDELNSQKEWRELCSYAETLFEKTGAITDAEKLAQGLFNSGRTVRLIEIFEPRQDLQKQSEHLRLLYGWSLFYAGRLRDSQAVLSELSGKGYQDANSRTLQVRLAISSGDWSALSAFVARESAEKINRSAKELMGAAELGIYVSSPDVPALVRAAVEKDENDPEILAAAYFLASRAGWEDCSDAAGWLRKAVKLSDGEGPIQTISLKEFVDRQPEWNRRESDVWNALSQGEVPMSVAAKSVNKSLINMVLIPAFGNLAKNDPRKRFSIPAFSGKRQQATFEFIGSVGFDAGALLTLGFLNILDKVLDACEEVFIPYATLDWLFEEKKQAAFHQPSRVKDAIQLSHLVASGSLEKLKTSLAPDSDLDALVGNDLALLISEAENEEGDGDQSGSQRLVVRPGPVHPVGSLLQEVADLTPHSGVLSSCSAIVAWLKEKGQITSDEEEKAQSYFRLHEKPWPNQPVITEGATLYLDSLSVTYFLHLRLLQQLSASGFRVIVSPSELSDASDLINAENTYGQVSDVIERVRATMHIRIGSGKVKVAPRNEFDDDLEKELSENPTFGAYNLARHCDSVIADDRFMNKHGWIENSGSRTPVFCTLDLLNGLADLDKLSSEELHKCRTRLRRAGYFCIPMNHQELVAHLKAASVEGSELLETAELKAIRENMLNIRMSGWLHLPDDSFWLHSTPKALVEVLRGLWTRELDVEETNAKSNWILGLIDDRGWIQAIAGDEQFSDVELRRATHTVMLLMPLPEQSPEINEAYSNWVDERLLGPIENNYPRLYSWIVDAYRSQIHEMAEGGLENTDES